MKVDGASGSFIPKTPMRQVFQRDFMKMGPGKKIRAYGTLIILSVVNVGIYGVVYLRSSFYSVMQEATGLTHTQMGNVWTAYGIVATLSYIFGGRLADIVSGKRLVLLSAIGIAGCGCVMLSLPSYQVMLVLYAGMGIFAVFTYYAVSVKIVNTVGRVIGSGKAFGLYWTMINLCNAVVTGINIHNSSLFLGQNAKIFCAALLIFIFITIFSAILFAILYRDDWAPGFETSAEKRDDKARFLAVLCNRTVILAGLVIFSNYFIISSFSYFVPYMYDVLGFSQTQVLIINLIKGEAVGTVITLTIGIITDKLSSALKLIMYTSYIGAGLLAGFVISTATLLVPLLIIVLMVLVTVFLNGSKSVAMVIPTEIKIPENYMGTAVGIISFIGYLPDAFYYAAAGKVIDAFGNSGYTMLFAFDIAIALMCALLCRELLKWGK